MKKTGLQMTKSENLRCFAFSETWRHLGIAQTSFVLLSVCTSFPREDLLSGIFFLLFSKFLFPVCFFCGLCLFNIAVYQLFMSNQQIFKKKIMMVVEACTFLTLLTNIPFYRRIELRSHRRSVIHRCKNKEKAEPPIL